MLPLPLFNLITLSCYSFYHCIKYVLASMQYLYILGRYNTIFPAHKYMHKRVKPDNQLSIAFFCLNSSSNPLPILHVMYNWEIQSNYCPEEENNWFTQPGSFGTYYPSFLNLPSSTLLNFCITVTLEFRIVTIIEVLPLLCS